MLKPASPIERVGYLDTNVQKALQFHWAAANQVLQRHPVHVFHGDEGMLVVRADLMDGADVGVIEGGRSTRHPSKPAPAGLALRPQAGISTRRNGRVRCPALYTNAHATAAQFLDDAVVRDGLADHGWQQW